MAPRVVRAWHRHSTLISVLILLTVAACPMVHYLTTPVHWATDGLFYRAKISEIRGENRAAAEREAFSSQAAQDVAQGVPQVHDPAWVAYSRRFYARRLIVPAIAASIEPVAGLERSLLWTSALGYLLLGPLLFLLLRRRFSPGVSLAVTAVCLLLPPLWRTSGTPLTDSWGLALLTLALLTGLSALERGGRWIAAFAVSMLVLSFTRDATLVVIVALGWVALMTRSRRSAAVLAAGVVAAIPAPLIRGVPLRDQLAWTLNGFHIPATASWSGVLSKYPGAMKDVLHNDFLYPRELPLPPAWYAVGAAILAALVYMVVAADRNDPFFALLEAALIGAALTVALAPNYTNMRLEIVFVPSVAAALAFALRSVLDAYQRLQHPNGSRSPRGSPTWAPAPRPAGGGTPTGASRGS